MLWLTYWMLRSMWKETLKPIMICQILVRLPQLGRAVFGYYETHMYCSIKNCN